LQENVMKLMLTLGGAAIAASLAGSGAAWAKEPEFVSVQMETTVNKPAADVWSKVGGYCDLSKWLSADREVPCVVTSGKGEVGTVRLIAGRVAEVMTAKSQFGYGYAQPAVEGKWYNHYHGFVEARPINATTSKIVYTLMLDVSDKADQAAKDADLAGRRKQFEAALANMKKIAEG
jgi:hypothetical protein